MFVLATLVRCSVRDRVFHTTRVRCSTDHHLTLRELKRLFMFSAESYSLRMNRPQPLRVCKSHFTSPVFPNTFCLQETPRAFLLPSCLTATRTDGRRLTPTPDLILVLTALQTAVPPHQTKTFTGHLRSPSPRPTHPPPPPPEELSGRRTALSAS